MTLSQLTQEDARRLLECANRQDWQSVHDIAKAIVGNTIELLIEDMYKENDNSEMFERWNR